MTASLVVMTRDQDTISSLFFLFLFVAFFFSGKRGRAGVQFLVACIGCWGAKQGRKVAAHMGRYLSHSWNTTPDSRNFQKRKKRTNRLTPSENYVGLLSVSCCWTHAFDLLRLMCSISHNEFESVLSLKTYIRHSGSGCQLLYRCMMKSEKETDNKWGESDTVGGILVEIRSNSFFSEQRP